MPTNTPIFCENCQKETEHRHLHDEAHGISGTHMSGTERYECNECKSLIFKEEGAKRGLNFILD